MLLLLNNNKGLIMLLKDSVRKKSFINLIELSRKCPDCQLQLGLKSIKQFGFACPHCRYDFSEYREVIENKLR